MFIWDVTIARFKLQKKFVKCVTPWSRDQRIDPSEFWQNSSEKESSSAGCLEEVSLVKQPLQELLVLYSEKTQAGDQAAPRSGTENIGAAAGFTALQSVVSKKESSQTCVFKLLAFNIVFQQRSAAAALPFMQSTQKPDRFMRSFCTGLLSVRYSPLSTFINSWHYDTHQIGTIIMTGR